MAVISPPYAMPEMRPFRAIQHRLRLAGGAVVTQNGRLESDDFEAGVAGWQINGEGNSEFNNVIVRGAIGDGTIDGELEVIGDLQSDNYAVGTDGWKISGNGDAEFNDIDARGTIDLGDGVLLESDVGIQIPAFNDDSIPFTPGGNDPKALSFLWAGSPTAQVWASHSDLFIRDYLHLHCLDQVSIECFEMHLEGDFRMGDGLFEHFIFDGVQVDSAWTDYSPSHTNLTVVNGSETARWMRFGKLTHFYWSLVVGSSDTIGGNIAIGLPVASNARQVFPATYENTGTRNYTGVATTSAGASTAALRQDVTGVGNVNATNPFTFTTGDLLVVSGSYEAD